MAGSGIARLVRGFALSERGVAAVEFAMILPLLLTLYLGGVEISQAVNVDRKVTLVARSVGDLVSQASTVTNVKLQGIFDAAKAIFAPYSTGPAGIVVASIRTDGSGKSTVDWSDAYGVKPDGSQATALTKGSVYKLPDGLAQPNSSVILADVTYAYMPPIGEAVMELLNLPNGMTLSEKAWLKPRTTTCITREGVSSCK